MLESGTQFFNMAALGILHGSLKGWMGVSQRKILILSQSSASSYKWSQNIYCVVKVAPSLLPCVSIQCLAWLLVFQTSGVGQCLCGASKSDLTCLFTIFKIQEAALGICLSFPVCLFQLLLKFFSCTQHGYRDSAAFQ